MNSYFSHDSNARNSDKLLPLRMKMGAEGYGIYFMILERLREEPNYMSVKDYNMLAFDLRVDSIKVKQVIEDFGLFVFTDNGKYFYSEGFMTRMKQKDEKSEKARASARSRWDKFERNANAMRTQCKESKVKERKGKEKDNTPYNPPLLSEMEKYFVENGYSKEAAQKAFQYYTAGGWKDSKGNQVHSWKQKCISVWFKPENKISANNPTDNIPV